MAGHQQRPLTPAVEQELRKTEELREAETKMRRGITWPPVQKPVEEENEDEGNNS